MPESQKQGATEEMSVPPQTHAVNVSPNVGVLGGGLRDDQVRIKDQKSSLCQAGSQ